MEHRDLKGLFVAGGGISGAMYAMRASGKATNVITVAHQLMDNTRTGLLDGALSMVLNDPLDRLAQETFTIIRRACVHPEERGRLTTVLPFEILRVRIHNPDTSSCREQNLKAANEKQECCALFCNKVGCW
jgi:LacI family transcriptional regulator